MDNIGTKISVCLIGVRLMESWLNSEKNKKFDSVERTYVGSFTVASRI